MYLLVLETFNSPFWNRLKHVNQMKKIFVLSMWSSEQGIGSKFKTSDVKFALLVILVQVVPSRNTEFKNYCS